jgi:3-isopropylmalate dehydrogenase
MTAAYSLLILPGDGIGPEVMRQVRRVIEWMERKRGLSFQLSEALVGGCSIDAHGVPLTPQVLEKAKNVDAVMLGAVGGPKWDGGKVAFEIRPEAALLALRKELGLFANLRPATVFDALVDASTLKAEVVKGLDIMIVRELTGGVYFGEPRGISDLPNGERIGVNTQTYTTSEIRRVAAVAFELARKRKNKVHSVEKCNVMESGLLWRQEVIRLHQEQYADVELEHMLADNCAMQLLKNPKQFDVIVTDNLFGDMLSDEASMLTGSLGMLPSASLGAPDADGKRKAMYEPIHGSAPDIAGRDIANPLATLLSFAMALRYSFDLEAEAVMIETAVQRLLAGGLRTADIMQPGMARCSTTVMGDTVLRELDKLQAAG